MQFFDDGVIFYLTMDKNSTAVKQIRLQKRVSVFLPTSDTSSYDTLGFARAVNTSVVEAHIMRHDGGEYPTA